jgi:hypothetical protein
VKSYVYGDPLVPVELRDKDAGLRPSHKKLLQLIDMTDPVWPTTAAILREMAEAGVEIDEVTHGIAVKVAAYRVKTAECRRQSSRRIAFVSVPLASMGSIVYYIRRGDLIKIGFTEDPAQRFSALLPDEILAYEPGGRNEETFRHRQFGHLQGRGENFRQAPELLEHIRGVREMYGDPDPAWPTVANHRGNRNAAVQIPDLDGGDGEMLTVPALCERLQVKGGTMRYWARQGKITVAGRNEYGRPLYSLEQATALRDKLADRKARPRKPRRQRSLTCKDYTG